MRLTTTKTHIVLNPKILLLGGTLHLNGTYHIVYDCMQWAIWDNNPYTTGEIVLLLDKSLELEQNNDYYEVVPQAGTTIEFAAKDAKLIRDLELERANKTYQLAKQIVNQYND